MVVAVFTYVISIIKDNITNLFLQFLLGYSYNWEDITNTWARFQTPHSPEKKILLHDMNIIFHLSLEQQKFEN